MAKNTILNDQKNNPSNYTLSAGISYTLGKFHLVLNERTGDLKILVHTNADSMKITPKSDNCIVIHACR